MDIAGIHHGSGVVLSTGTADDDTLGQNFFGLFRTFLTEGMTLGNSADGGLLTVGSLLPPFLRRERNMAIDSVDLTFGRPAGSTVLTVADGFAFDEPFPRLQVCMKRPLSCQ